MADQQVETHWRQLLRQHLTASLNKPIVLGELLDRFAPMVPLHHATRFNVTQRAGRAATIDMMREACVRGELRRYPFAWNIERKTGLPIPRTAALTPVARHCKRCGAPFFSIKSVVHCSAACAMTTSRNAIERAVEDAPQPSNIARLIRRIDNAIEELERIKDVLLALRRQGAVHNGAGGHEARADL